MRNRVWYFIKNFLLAILVFAAGCAASTALAVLLIVFGIILIFTGLSALGTYFFVNNDGNVEYMGVGSQLLAAAIFCVPGYLLIKFADTIVHSFEWFTVLAGAFFVIMGIWRARVCNREAYEVYVSKAPAVLSYVYPLAMMGGGAALAFSYIRPALDGLASFLLVLAPILWIVRAVLVCRDNG